MSATVKNPGLHELYTKWAMHHLKAIEDAITKLDSFSKLSLLEIIGAMKEQKAKLISENPAYRDAAAKLFAGEELRPYNEYE
jgi:hypothetical protein